MIIYTYSVSEDNVKKENKDKPIDTQLLQTVDTVR